MDLMSDVAYEGADFVEDANWKEMWVGMALERTSQYQLAYLLDVCISFRISWGVWAASAIQPVSP